MENPQIKQNKISLKTKMIIIFLCVGIIPLIIFSINSIMIIKASMYESEVMSLRQISSMVTANLDKWGDDNLLLVEDVANSQVVKSNNIDHIKNELKNKQGQDMNIYNLMYVDTAGNILADSLGSRNGNISNEEYFTEVSKGFSYNSNTIIDKENSFPFMIFSSPVKSNNEIIGYIINKIKIDSINESIGNIFYSENGQIFTFSNDGIITYHSDSMNSINQNIFTDSSKLSEGCKKALEGNFNSIQYTFNGVSGVAVYNYIPSLDWGIMTTTPNSDIYNGFNKVLLSSIPVLIIVLILILISAFYVLKLVTKPITQMASLTQSVAQGDLTVQCNLGGSIEMMRIGQDINEMVNSLKNLVLSISNKNTELNEAAIILDDMASSAEESSKDISKAMNEIARGSVAQASGTDTVLNHVKNLDEKMSELTHRISETNKALEVSNIALSKGNNGTQHLKDSTETQYKLVNQAVSQVNELSDFVSNIDEIIETIRDIAEQTSLLSLNASIEAARAGESGKGFAVVAEEVGKLANESQIATQRTAEILNSIKNKADSTTKIMNSINDGMILQSSNVNETISAFSEITESDNKISDNIKSFSNLIDYIKNFSNELLSLIETLASSSEESAAVSEEVTASSDEQIAVVEQVKKSSHNILNIVDELKNNIEKFNI